MEENLILNFKSEFFEEIDNYKLSSKDLKKIGASDQSLLAEIYLKKLYGEEIIIDEEIENKIDLSQKKIEKVDLNELEKVSQLSSYIENISKSEFDDKLEIIMSKIRKEN